MPAMAAGAAAGVLTATSLMPAPYRPLMGSGPNLKTDLWTGALAEGGLTFAINLIVLYVVLRGTSNRFLQTPLIVACALVLVQQGAKYTGPAMNPSDAFGWAYLNKTSSVSEQLVVYWLSPLLGTVAAAMVFRGGFGSRLESHNCSLQSHRNIDVKMAPGQLILVLACFLIGFSSTNSSKIYHRREGLLHDDETDSSSHGLSHASFLELSLGEADALLAFKDGIGNYLEGALDDWTPGKRSEYCSWTGVTCNRQLHVTALNLSSLDLTGSLGPSLGNLSHLEELHLDQNFLHSKIPPELGRLSRLRILNLEENWLYGSIPKELGNLTSLQVLNLGSQGSWLNGTIPEELGQLSELRFLNLGAVNNWYAEKAFWMTATNKLRGTIPSSLGNCTKLWYLDFYGNEHLTGVIPKELGKLIHLKYLSFELNNLTGVDPPHQLGNLTKCKYLLLRNNSLQGHLPVGLANLSRLLALDVGFNIFTGNLVHVSSTSWSELVYLSAHYNSFTGTFPELLFSCSNLKLLYLSYNNFSGNLPADLGRLSSARMIFMEENMFGGGIPESLTNISFLAHLSLSNNKFTGPLDALRNSTNLQVLNLGSSGLVQNKFTGSLTNAMVRWWPKMKYLYLYNNALMGKLPRALGNLTQLIGLALYTNKFDGGIPEELGDMQKLKYLYLQDNELTGKIPSSLANLQDVISIYLGNNNLTGSIPQQLGNLTKILHLSLHTNNLTGEIPPDLGNLQTLEILYLVNNNLIGNIPVTLSNCSALKQMRLSYNSLTGHITHINFIGLENLWILALNGNQLTGLFPVTLWNCSNLELLDLSSNHLSAVLPKFNVLNLQLDQPQVYPLRGLKVLSLRSNFFSGSIPSSIWKLPALQVLDLSFNSFTGVLPQDLSGLVTYKLPAERKLQEAERRLYKTLTVEDIFEAISLRKAENTLLYVDVQHAMALLDISVGYFQLTGELPAELGTLHRLTTLFMADNNFEGSIPAELGEIPDLLELDLSKNQLSGPIPMSLSRLRLGYLNLSLNQLCGPIPIAESFDTRFFGSFQPGNPKLCGDSIDKPCESFAFSCNGHLDPGTVTQQEKSWSLYFHGEFVTAFAVGASIGFSTVIGLITLIPTFRNRFLFQKYPTIDHSQSDYGLFRRPT
ncbi:hypothetical protein MARPO_1037s0001 [Marchantia polymorpha]|uniref:Uncharacterized protein n=1 Tax=Marchantia polymorpha TaxID=3197 RepID=A0A2R6VY66_MARPO|nr:hypothetical protein MARPO_1037s0001 [Marchantia polymorpha]|eukprot:PTQ26541.1 hypothetical protein MARPO_1037s0001 [Marchantia polymorpha]